MAAAVARGGDGERVTVSVSAPGKVILHGEHAVVYGKTAIAASLGLRSSIVIKEVESSEYAIRIHLPSVELEESLAIQPVVERLFRPPLACGVTGKFSWKLPERLDHERHLAAVDSFLLQHKPHVEHLQRNQKNALRAFLYMFSGIFGGSGVKIRPMDISMGSELVVGAGTGSSASYAVCLAGALLRLLRLRGGAGGGAGGGGGGGAAAYEPGDADGFTAAERELISDWAFNCEKIMHGLPSGIDNATCTYGAIVTFRKGSRPRPLDIRLSMRVLLVDTRVSRETKTLVTKVAALRQRNPGVVDPILEACDNLTRSAIQVMENISDQLGKSDSDEIHYQHLAELWDMNHWLLGALGVSHASLERVRAAAGARGLACKLTGAGGGGYAMVLIPPSTARTAVDSLTSQLLELGFRVTETRLGGAGVRLGM